jgi:hypothetical protein
MADNIDLNLINKISHDLIIKHLLQNEVSSLCHHKNSKNDNLEKI